MDAGAHAKSHGRVVPATTWVGVGVGAIQFRGASPRFQPFGFDAACYALSRITVWKSICDGASVKISRHGRNLCARCIDPSNRPR